MEAEKQFLETKVSGDSWVLGNKTRGVSSKVFQLLKLNMA